MLTNLIRTVGVFALLFACLLIAHVSAFAQDFMTGGGLETATTNGNSNAQATGLGSGQGIDWDRNNPGQGTLGAPGQQDAPEALTSSDDDGNNGRRRHGRD